MKQSNQSSERVRGPSSATGYIRARSGLSPNAGVRCVPDGVIILYCHVLERSEMARGNNKKKKKIPTFPQLSSKSTPMTTPQLTNVCCDTAGRISRICRAAG